MCHVNRGVIVSPCLGASSCSDSHSVLSVFFSQMFDSCETSFMKHFILKIPYEHIHTCVCVSAAANVESTSLIK